MKKGTLLKVAPETVLTNGTTIQTDARTFLLRKRYSDPNDLPCVTYDEVAHALRAILTVANTYSPVVSPGGMFANDRFFDSLTPDQRERAKQGLRFADLTPAQNTLAISALEQSILEPRENLIRSTSQLIETLTRSNTVVQWVDWTLPDATKTKVLGVHGDFGLEGKPSERPLTEYLGLGGGFNTRQSGVVSPNSEDFRLAPLGMLANRLASTMTLAEATRKAEAMSAGGVAHASAAVSIADKPVNVFGLQYGGGTRPVVEALARIYGLQLEAGSNGRNSIDVPRPGPINDPTEIQGEISRLIPLPLRDAFAGQMRVADSRVLDGTLAAASPTRDTETKSFYRTAARRLVALAEPAVPTPSSHAVPMSGLSPEVYRLLAITSMTDSFMREVRDLESYTPPASLLHPEHAIVQMARGTGAAGSGRAWLNFSFSHPGDDGGLVCDAAGGSTTVPPARTTPSGQIGQP